MKKLLIPFIAVTLAVIVVFGFFSPEIKGLASMSAPYISTPLMEEIAPTSNVTGTWQDTGFVATSFNGGNGTTGNPYQIATAQQLAFLARRVNAGGLNITTFTGFEAFQNTHFRLTNNIDLRSRAWVAIGGGQSAIFMGIFDGNGHEITLPQTIRQEVLTMRHNNHTGFGLFGRVHNARIENLNLRGDLIDWQAPPEIQNMSNRHIGALVAVAGESTISNVTFVGHLSNIVAPRWQIMAGGLIGTARNVTLNNVRNEARINVISTEESLAYVGGIIGHAESASLTNVVNRGNISEVIATTALYIGGIIGHANGIVSIYNFANYGNVHADLFAFHVRPRTANAGGVIGRLVNTVSSSITNGYNTGNVTILGSPTQSGSLVGGIGGHLMSNVTIENVYSIGTLTGEVTETINPTNPNGGARATLIHALAHNATTTALNNHRQTLGATRLARTTEWANNSGEMPRLRNLTFVQFVEPPPLPTFTVTFRSHDNQVLYTRTQTQGTIITPIEAPTIQNHVFLYWCIVSGNDLFTAITTNTTFIAIYQALPMSRVSVAFLDTGEELASFVVLQGTGIRTTDIVAVVADVVVPQWYVLAWLDNWLTGAILFGDEFVPITGDRVFYFHFVREMQTVYVNYFTLARISFDENANHHGIQPTGLITTTILIVGGLLIASVFLTEIIHSTTSQLMPMDMVVRVTIPVTAWTYNIHNNNLCEYIPDGIFNRRGHDNIPGWRFTGWQRNSQGVFVAQYDKPTITVRYFGSNGAFIREDQLEFTLAPVTELRGSRWHERLGHGFRQVFINWNIGGMIDDNRAQHMFNDLITGLAGMWETNVFEPYFLMANPDLHIEEGFGIFRASGAEVTSSLFRVAYGTARNNDFLLWADFSGAYVFNARWEIMVHFGTPWDTGFNIIAGIVRAFQSFFGWLGDFISSGGLMTILWVIIGLIVLFALMFIRKLFRFIKAVFMFVTFPIRAILRRVR